MRFLAEEKLEIIALVRYSGLEFSKTLSLFGVKPARVWHWIDKIQEQGLAGLCDQLPIPKTYPGGHLPAETRLILDKARCYPHLTHRKLVHQIFRDEDIFVSPSLVYRIFQKHQLIRTRPQKQRAAQYWSISPGYANHIWHIDISYVLVGLTSKGRRIFWYLVVLLDGYSRMVFSWGLFPDQRRERVFEVVMRASSRQVGTGNSLLKRVSRL